MDENTVKKLVEADALDFFCGEHLGSGMSRDVYLLRTDHSKVVKVERSNNRFQNVDEFNNWEKCCHAKKIARWLSPCHHISTFGTILIMDRVEPIGRKELPKKLPEFLTDIKLANFGRHPNGKIVCCDYASIISDLSWKKKKVKEWY